MTEALPSRRRRREKGKKKKKQPHIEDKVKCLDGCASLANQRRSACPPPLRETANAQAEGGQITVYLTCARDG